MRCTRLLIHRLRAAALLLALVTLAVPAMAQAPTYEVHPDFLVKRWTVEDGLPVNQINDLVQTRDGYLWLATFDGLVRFDGDRFTVFNTSNSPGLPSNRLYWLHEDTEGALWIMTESREVARYAQGVFTPFSQNNDLPGYLNFFQDADTLWLQTVGGLARYRDGTMQPYRPDLIRWGVQVMLRDRAGTLWIGGKGKIICIDPDGTEKQFTTGDGLPGTDIHALFEDRDGTIWAAMKDGLARVRHDHLEPLRPEAPPWSASYATIHQDTSGTIWFGNEREWWGYRDGRLERFPAVEPGVTGRRMLHEPGGHTWRVVFPWLYRDAVPVLHLAPPVPSKGGQAMLIDREGNLWYGNNGLYRIRPRLLHTISEAEGLPGRNVYPILEGRDGSIWLGLWGEESLVRLKNESLTSFDVRSLNLQDKPTRHFVTALYQDRAGTLWVGTLGRLCRMQGRRCVPISLYPAVSLATSARYTKTAGAASGSAAPRA